MHRLLLLAVVLLLPATAFAQHAEVSLARQHVDQNARAFAAPPGSADEARVTAAYYSRGTGLTQVYLRQTIDGIEVRDGDITVSLRGDGSVLHAAGSFFHDLEAVTARFASLSPADAANVVARHLGFDPPQPFTIQESPRGADQATVLSDGGVAAEPVEARLIYEPTERGLRLAWDVTFHEPDDPHVWSIRVDAATAEILAQNDYVVHDHWGDAHGNRVGFSHGEASAPVSLVEAAGGGHIEAAPTSHEGRGAGGTYRVFAYPLESPNHGNRTLVTNPADPQASPFGWHDTDGTPGANFTTSRGNNVFAYVDANNSNQPNGVDAVPDGGEDLIFDFPIDLTQQPVTYRLAAVTNLFYWNNLIHDVLWHYGFDEPAGNFQQTNYTGLGLGNDAVRAEAQDGGGMNNANFFTPVDGQAPRMQMYLWNTANPLIDGDFDNGVIAHEYAHGWSIRLTGGPSNVGCLWNSEQMGEGWSDYLGLILTMRFGDYAEQIRGIGTFVRNQPTNGPGIRPAPYSTSMDVNSYTYGNIGSLSIPHGVGFVWATMLWEMTWNLIHAHGSDLDMVNGTSGNNMALRLVSEAMKLQPCSPGFVDGRNAILAADQALYGGANALHIWRAFAKRGLGYSASQGSSGSTSDGTEAFDMPPGMYRDVTVTTDPELVPAGEFVTYTLELTNGEALEPLEDVTLKAEVPEGLIFAPGHASEGAIFDGETGTISFNIGSIGTGEAVTRSFMALADEDEGSTLLFEDNMEDGTDGWEVGHGVGTVTWFQQAGSGENGSTAWYARNMASPSDQYLMLEEPVIPTSGTVLSFRHRYHTEPRWDGGVIEISVSGGAWTDLGEHITSNGYNNDIRPTATGNPLAGRNAYTGNSGGFITSTVDLSSFVGQSVRIRFRLGTDNTGGFPTYQGWYVDWVLIIEDVSFAVEVCASTPSEGLACGGRTTMVIGPLEGTPALDHDLSDMWFEVEPNESTTVTMSFSNQGDRDLIATVGTLNLDGLAAVAGGMFEVGPNEDQEFVLEIAPLDVEPGVYHGELVLVTNDPEARRVAVSLTLYVGVVGTETGASMPDGFLFDAVHPNPFTHTAHMTLRVAEAQAVSIVLYDVMGREVLRLHDGELAPETPHSFNVNGASLASGVYILSIRGEHFTTTQRITRLR